MPDPRQHAKLSFPLDEVLLLCLLAIEGAIVTIDAMGCQRNIAHIIIEKRADGMLALKGDQGSLREDVELFATTQLAQEFSGTTISQDTTIEGDHGRIETRTTTVIHDVAWLQKRHDWPGLKGVVTIQSTRQMSDRTEQEARYHLTSLTLLANQLGPIVRQPWAVENSLHWV